jgi:hypothetical protein
MWGAGMDGIPNGAQRPAHKGMRAQLHRVACFASLVDNSMGDWLCWSGTPLSSSSPACFFFLFDEKKRQFIWILIISASTN